MKSKYHFLNQPGPHFIAHRGGNAAGKDKLNTLPAFQSAVDLGYKYIETDVVLTADGKVIVYHGARSKRQEKKTAQQKRKTIQKMTYDQINKYINPDGENVPLLEEVLGSFPKALFNIDAKTKEVVRPLAEAIRKTASLNRVCVASFSHKRTLGVANLLGGQDNVCTSLGPAGFSAYLLHSKMKSAFANKITRLGVGCLQVPYKLVTKDLIKTAHQNGILVHVWTVNQAAAMAKMLELGVDGIVTDETTRLMKVAGRSK
jgi:glycerophosphoryl diester phosphodiesterase